MFSDDFGLGVDDLYQTERKELTSREVGGKRGPTAGFVFGSPSSFHLKTPADVKKFKQRRLAMHPVGGSIHGKVVNPTHME